MIKNLTPHVLTIIVTSISTGVCALVLILDTILHNEPPNYLFLFLALLFLYIALYGIVRYLIERYIYKRITPIYKIVRTKQFTEKPKIDGSEFKKDIIGELDVKVKAWAKAQTEELQTLKKLAEYRKDYVGNISHELKTPLFSIQGYIHTLLEGVEDPTMRKKFLRRAASNVERLKQIVDDLEMITNLEVGALSIEKEDFDLRKLVEEVFQDLSFQAENEKITFNFFHNNLSSYLVKGDKEAIRQVLNNLIVNSLKYGKEDGQTTVIFSSMGKFLLVEVSDDGPGIEEEHLPHLFDRFYRTESSRNRKIGGSGLGLSIVKHIIEAHGETVSVRSTIGKGTTFAFTLQKV